MIRNHLGYVDFNFRPEKGGSAPIPPKPAATAEAATNIYQQNAKYSQSANNGNVYTPYGSSVFTPRVDPVTGATTYDQKISLDPTQQQTYDKQQGQDLAMTGISDALIQQAKTSTANPLSAPKLAGVDDIEGSRKAIADALYGRQAAYLDPQWQTRDSQLQTRLAAQGITQNSEAWNNAMAEANRARTFDYSQARDSSIANSGSEAVKLGSFQNSAAQQQLANAITLRDQPLNELAGIRDATKVNMPQFEGASRQNVPAVDLASLINGEYGANLDIWNAQQQSNNAMTQGAVGLAGQLGSAYLMGGNGGGASGASGIGSKIGSIFGGSTAAPTVYNAGAGAGSISAGQAAALNLPASEASAISPELAHALNIDDAGYNPAATSTQAPAQSIWATNPLLNYGGAALGAYNIYGGIQDGNPTQALGGGAMLAQTGVGGSLGMGGMAAGLGAGAAAFGIAALGNQMLGNNDPYALDQGVNYDAATGTASQGNFSAQFSTDKGLMKNTNGTSYRDASGRVIAVPLLNGRTGNNAKMVYEYLQQQGAQLPPYEQFVAEWNAFGAHQ